MAKRRDHLDMLCDIGEISVLLAGSTNVESFLERIVERVARHLAANVCSIYVYEEESEELVLRANCGLNREQVNGLRLKVSEGLVGKALRELRPVIDGRASTHPAYKPIAGLNEEEFDAFLAVPILRGIERVGVLVVQRDRKKPFDQDDVSALRATASQLAGGIENARVLMNLREGEPVRWPLPTKTARQQIQGTPAVEGVALGRTLVLRRDQDESDSTEPESGGPLTLDDFEHAVQTTATELERLQDELQEKLPEMGSLIFSAHVLILKDDSFTGAMRRQIQEGRGPGEAVVDVSQKVIQRFQGSSNPYFREKVQDLKDVTRRLRAKLSRARGPETQNLRDRIVVAAEIYPSDILEVASEEAAGLILAGAGVTAHVIILARSLQLPTVIVNHDVLGGIAAGVELAVDGEQGTIHVLPDAGTIERLRGREQARQGLLSHASCPLNRETRMQDGTRVRLRATINLLGDVKIARELGAEGVGLYRTEFAFLMRADLPSEDEQVLIYEQFVRQLRNERVTFRSLDVGGDKLLAYFGDAGQEKNPFLGMRSIRVSLRHPGIFRQQVRAILRATAGATDVRLMFPMISSIDEFSKARDIVLECADSLRADGYDDISIPEIGAMVEIPSLLAVLDELTADADFLCIGSNDFIQYMLAVDRTNEKVADYFLPHHPAVLRGLKTVADAGLRHGKPVSICGEMAHNRQYVPFLIGIGIREISTDPHYLPPTREQVYGLTLAQARDYANALLEPATVTGVTERLRDLWNGSETSAASLP